MRSLFCARKIATLSVLTALALVVSWLEKPLIAALPLPLPGFKLGLSNIVTLFALYRLGPKESGLVLFLRIALGALLFGTPVSFVLSLSGGLVSFAAAVLLYRRESVSALGVGTAASACHMLGQITAAAFILATPALFLSYLPWLLLLSVPTGLLTGSVAGSLVKRVRL